MKHASLAAAAAIVVLSSAFALLHAARNRTGNPDAQITVTDRELKYYREPDDSGVALNLTWVDSNAQYAPWIYQDETWVPWLNQQILQGLGFDCSVAPADRGADTFYARQQPRRGYVALEFDGPAWRMWLELRNRQIEKQRPLGNNFAGNILDDELLSSRLVAIDASSDPAALRTRHPDRNKVVILPAVIQIYLTPRIPAAQGRPERPALLTGMIQQIPYSIHVSKPVSERFQSLSQTSRDAKQDQALYRVQLSFGSSLEPWVTSAEISGR